MNAGFDAGTLIGTNRRGESVRLVTDTQVGEGSRAVRQRYRVFVAGRVVHTTYLKASALAVAHKRIVSDHD